MDSLWEQRRRFRKTLTRRNHNRGSRDRVFGLPIVVLLTGEHESLSLRGGSLGGLSGRGPPAGLKVAGGPTGTGGVLHFGELLCLPNVGVFFGKSLRVAIKCGRGC